MTSRLRVAVLFGGQSSEHDVSLLSARNVIKAIDVEKYEIVPIVISRDGRWLLIDLEGSSLPDPVAYAGLEVCLLPGGKGRILAVSDPAGPRELPAIDILFPVLHGLYGEDGSIQGLARMIGVPLVGCGILGSATAIDKDIAKRLLRDAGLPVARSITVRPGDHPSFEEAASKLGSPIFVKPVRQGSSVGVSKAANADEFRAALVEAFKHDDKVLIEEFVKAREIECAVLEQTDGTLFVSLPGEIVTGQDHSFYTYEAKYIDEDGAVTRVPAELPADLTQRLRELSQDAFRALGCESLARVDFFVRPDMSMVVNEVNTMPGFTNISMYPKAMEASGISYPVLVDRLIEHGLARGGR
ncbi:D-alanine--D-alanine ligase [Rhizobium rhizogenes]|uniref:D-alanine--D-alanine ligase family protein n=1 Tax=Rhizobium rhizogenes TaxID=359 RepID=UPI0006491F00|nr:D-alanine--D-alanine ligase family protein [Rhizobium rhizogenes]